MVDDQEPRQVALRNELERLTSLRAEVNQTLEALLAGRRQARNNHSAHLREIDLFEELLDGTPGHDEAAELRAHLDAAHGAADRCRQELVDWQVSIDRATERVHELDRDIALLKRELTLDDPGAPD